MSQFFKKSSKNNLSKSDGKTISVEDDDIKVTGKKEEISQKELNLDSVGSGGKDANYSTTSKFYNIFAVSNNQGTSLVASPNISPDGFGKNFLIGRALVNPNTEEIISIKYDYTSDRSMSNVLELTNTEYIDPNISLSKMSISNWFLNYTGSTTLSWTSVTFGNGLFVAVSNSGTVNRVMSSSDGINWTSRTSSSSNNWTSVTFGNGLFVAVSNSGTGNRVMSSLDGITWTSRTSASDNNWTSVTFGNGLFVAVSNSGTGNRVMTSTNGTSWVSRTSPSDNNWTSVTFGNGLFVAVSNSGTGNRVMSSSDGVTWVSRTSAFDSSWSSVTFGNDKFVAIASNSSTMNKRVMYSLNGLSWSLGNIITNSSSNVNDGSDGALVVNSGQTIQISEGTVKKYTSINIASGGILEITGNEGGWTEIGCSGNCVINGQIIARSGKTGESTHSSKTFTKNSFFGLGDLAYTISQKSGGAGTDGASWYFRYFSSLGGISSRSRYVSPGLGGSQYDGGGGGGGGCGGKVSSSGSLAGGNGGYRSVSVGGILTNYQEGSSSSAPSRDAQGSQSKGEGGLGGGLGHGSDYSFSLFANYTRFNGGDGWNGGGSGAGTYSNQKGYGGGGGGYKGHHGKGLVLFIEGPISGSGSIVASGNNGFNGGKGNKLSSTSTVFSGRGGGGAGGSGGSVIVRHSGGTVPTINVSGGEGGLGGSEGNGIANSGEKGNEGSFSIINIGSDPAENTWSSISYGSNHFVAVASSGTGTRMMTSSDGITWNLSKIIFSNSWTSICFGNGNFTAVSSNAPKTGYQALTNLRF